MEEDTNKKMAIKKMADFSYMKNVPRRAKQFG